MQPRGKPAGGLHSGKDSFTLRTHTHAPNKQHPCFYSVTTLLMLSFPHYILCEFTNYVPIHKVHIKLLHTIQAGWGWVEKLHCHTVNYEWKYFQKLFPVICTVLPLWPNFPELLPTSSQTDKIKRIQKKSSTSNWSGVSSKRDPQTLVQKLVHCWLTPSWHSPPVRMIQSTEDGLALT